MGKTFGVVTVASTAIVTVPSLGPARSPWFKPKTAGVLHSNLSRPVCEAVSDGHLVSWLFSGINICRHGTINVRFKFGKGGHCAPFRTQQPASSWATCVCLATYIVELAATAICPCQPSAAALHPPKPTPLARLRQLNPCLLFLTFALQGVRNLGASGDHAPFQLQR